MQVNGQVEQKDSGKREQSYNKLQWKAEKQRRNWIRRNLETSYWNSSQEVNLFHSTQVHHQQIIHKTTKNQAVFDHLAKL